MARGTLGDRGGFTLLEVLIAFAILAVGVVSLIQLTSQGLRLLKVSGDHQQAVQLADRLARDTQVIEEEVKAEATVETGEEGAFAWERRVTRVALPEELEPQTPVPGKEVPGLYSVAVAVRWGHNHMVEVATLRAPTGPAVEAGTNPADPQGQTGQGGAIPGGPRPGSAGGLRRGPQPGRARRGRSARAAPAAAPHGHPAMKRRGQRGFTLLELVLALSIVAAMLAIIFGGLRVGIRAWQRGDERTESQQHARSLNALLALSLGGTAAYLGPAPAGVQPEVLFQGAPDRLSFVTVSAPFPLPAPIAFTAVTLSIDEGDKPGLAIREKALPNDDPFEDVAPIVVDPSFTAVRFRYLRDTEGSWEESWDGAQERAVPRAVEVTLTTMVGGQPVEQPPVSVSIRVTSP